MTTELIGMTLIAAAMLFISFKLYRLGNRFVSGPSYPRQVAPITKDVSGRNASRPDHRIGHEDTTDPRIGHEDTTDSRNTDGRDEISKIGATAFRASSGLPPSTRSMAVIAGYSSPFDYSEGNRDVA
jgi:hypothetical protein